MTQHKSDLLASFIDEARHLTTNLNIFVSDMIRDKDLVRQLDHEPDELAAKYRFSQAEIDALRERDMPRLYQLDYTRFCSSALPAWWGFSNIGKRWAHPAEKTGHEFTQLGRRAT